MYRQLKITMVKECMDFYSFDEGDKGLDMWSRDALMYNANKFKMDLKNVITEKDLEEDDDDGKSMFSVLYADKKSHFSDKLIPAKVKSKPKPKP